MVCKFDEGDTVGVFILTGSSIRLGKDNILNLGTDVGAVLGLVLCKESGIDLGAKIGAALGLALGLELGSGLGSLLGIGFVMLI